MISIYIVHIYLVAGVDYYALAGSICTDISVYNAALAACVALCTDTVTVLVVLTQCCRRGVILTDLSYQILAKLCIKLGVASTVPILLQGCPPSLVQEELLLHAIHSREYSTIPSDKSTTISAGAGRRPGVVYEGCLGVGAGEEMRASVVQHDAMRLLDRLDPALGATSMSIGTGAGELEGSSGGGVALGVSEQDWATLVHQCRKRKWSQQVL